MYSWREDITETAACYHSEHEQLMPAGLAEASKMEQTTRGAWQKWEVPGRVGTAAPGEPILITSELRQSHKVGSPWVRFHHSGERMVKVNYWLTQTGLPVITHSAPMLRMQFPIHSYRQRSHSQGGGPPPPICSQGSTFSFSLFLIRRGRIRTPT